MILAVLPGLAMPVFAAGNPIIVIQINGDDQQGGTSLENAISNSEKEINSIKQLKITHGKVTTGDWQYIINLSQMTNFEIDAAVTDVADIPDLSERSAVGLFPTSVQSVKVPQEITVGICAFSSCKNLTTVDFPKATELRRESFCYCEKLKTANFPLVTKIESFTFVCCALERAEFPEAVTIGQSAFRGNKELTSVSLDKATMIDYGAFAECENLATVNLPNATAIGTHIFDCCTNLKTAILPNITIISDEAFQNCTNLIEVSLPKATIITEGAFLSCTALTTLKLGAIPPTVGSDAFLDVPKTNTLVFLNPDGTELTGGGLTTAQTAYKAVNDQDTSDNLWYGWKITGDSTPPEDSTHKHCLCGGTNNVGDHTSHTSVGFKEWNTNNAMPTEAGNYYLNTDVTLSSEWEVNADIGLCLNGHTIKITANSGTVICVEDGNTLNLCDCNIPISCGAITGGSGTSGHNQSDFSKADYNGNGVYVSSNGTFNMYGGKITGNTANYQGGGVQNYGNFTMYGGSITDNTILGGDGDGDGGGVYNEGTFTIYDGTISNNKAPFYGGGVYNEKTFTMNGGIIRGNQSGDRTSSTNNIGGGGIANFGTFTMNNGEISSNQAMLEGGGVYNKGTFNMKNGKISTNTVNGSSPGGCFGGGVANHGVFTMNGGGEIGSNKAQGGTAVGGGVYNIGTFNMGGTSSIISNTASSSTIAQGGGIYNQGSLSMKGCKITNNSVAGTVQTAGGGVYDNKGDSFISGAPVIISNLANNGKGYDKSNWLIFYTNPFQFAEPLTAGASIGVSMGYSIADDYRGFFTYDYNPQNGNVDPAIYFSSDDPKYHVELIKNRAKMVMGSALKIIISGLNTAKVGSPYSQEILTSYNGTGTKTYSATGLPSGLSINASSGMITGTPTAAADTGSPYSVTIKVSDGTISDSKTFSMTVDVSDANKTYTVTFNENGGSGTMSVQSFNATTPQSLTLNAFTRAGYTFKGWNTTKEGTGDSYNDGASYTAVTNATLYAQWEEITYTVSGTVKDKDDKIVSGAEVKLMKGNLQIGATVTDENGNFSILKVPNGTYNLVASKDGITVTSMITVSNADMTLKSAIILPIGKTNSVLVVKPNTPQIVVGNLDGQFSSIATDNDKGVIDADQTVVKNGGVVEIKLTAEKKDDTAPKASDITATAKQDGKTVGIFIDFSLVKTVTPTSGGISTQTTLTQLQELIDVLIPLDTELQNKNGYVVYRYHGNAVDTISTNLNQDGEKIELIDGGKTIKLTIKKFSTYAIGYTAPSVPPAVPPTGGGSSGGNSGSNSGSGSNSNATKDNSNTTKDNSNTGLPYYIKSGNKIYLGYSSPISGTMKYIAPKGEVVLFKENPKNFIDISSHWAKDNIDFVTERELFIGTAPNVFSPDDSMTRAMFATVIGRLHERSFGEISQSDEKPFTDISYNSYYTKYVIWAEKNGIVKGIGGGKFEPQRAITRQEMAMLVNNYLTFAKFNIPVTQQAILFDDESKIADWAKPATQTVQKLGIMEGKGQNLFDPQNVSTRAQVSAILQRMISEVILKNSN